MSETVAIRPTPRHGTPALRRALVVDDEPAVRAVLARWLRRTGWAVDLATDGESAAELLAASASNAATVHALVICDVRMPRRSGPELFAWMREHVPELCRHVVFSSGDTRDPSIADFLAACGCPVLEKPFQLSELAHAVSIVAPVPSRAA